MGHRISCTSQMDWVEQCLVYPLQKLSTFAHPGVWTYHYLPWSIVASSIFGQKMLLMRKESSDSVVPTLSSKRSVNASTTKVMSASLPMISITMFTPLLLFSSPTCGSYRRRCSLKNCTLTSCMCWSLMRKARRYLHSMCWCTDFLRSILPCYALCPNILSRS